MQARTDSSMSIARHRALGRGPGLALGIALLCAALPLAPLPTHADASPQDLAPARLKKLSLEQLFDLQVTTVSQKPESLSKAAAAIHVVTQSDIREMGAQSIAEALRDIPGVEVARVDSRQYAITARGFNGTVANKLLVLMDGRSLYTPLFSGVFWDAQDAFMDDIEQIEVIRGPGATVWGANAVNGVINIRTKDATQTQGWLVEGGGGDAERGFGGARYGGRIRQDLFFRAYGKHFERASSLRPDGSETGDDFRMSQGGFRLDDNPEGRDAFTLQGDAYSGTGDQLAAAATDLKGGNVLTRWTRRFSPASDLQVQAYYDRTDRQIPSLFGEVLDTYDLELRHRFGARRQDVVWGLGYRLTRDDVRNSPGLAFLPPRLAQGLFSGFLQDELSLADQLRLTLGSKLEHNDYTGYEYEPSARLAWLPVPTQTLWAAASRAVRAPSRIDRDFFAPGTPPYFLVGGEGFESEILRAFEIGYKANPIPAVGGSVSIFYNGYDRLRSVEAGPPFHLGNGLEGDGHGAEAEVSWQISRPWRLSAGYTFLKLDVERTPASADSTSESQEGDSPEHQAFVRSSLAVPGGVSVDLSARYVGELPDQHVAAYTTGDARLAWQVRGGLEFEVVGRDLFAPRHVEFGTPTARTEVARSVYGKVTWSL